METQLDYGEGAPTRILAATRYRKPRLFVTNAALLAVQLSTRGVEVQPADLGRLHKEG